MNFFLCKKCRSQIIVEEDGEEKRIGRRTMTFFAKFENGINVMIEDHGFVMELIGSQILQRLFCIQCVRAIGITNGRNMILFRETQYTVKIEKKKKKKTK